MTALGIDDVAAAAARIAGRVMHTPVVASRTLDEMLGHSLLFKCENLQRIGAFKARGALNTMLWMREQGTLPASVVAFSSGNHAQAVAWAARDLGVRATIFMHAQSSAVKRAATESYGARVILRDRRADAEREAEEMGAEPGFALIPPYDHDQIICGQGTSALEALGDHPEVEAVFVPVGGGGLLSGTVIATQGSGPAPNKRGAPRQVFGGEPLLANDAARSLREGRIVSFDDAPPTMADGARTLSLSARTLHYAKRSDGILEIAEDAMAYWTQWLVHLLKLQIEPTGALGMAAAAQWLAQQPAAPRRTALVILSGGNADAAMMRRVWETDHLTRSPSTKR
ncbi:MAG: serine/threonine dehydratase [Planctomycetota bacterium]|nr:serine/threonine dehydratase [Planctomycetota bacterium]